MRFVVGIALLLSGVGMWFCRWDGPSVQTPARAATVDWVRTVDGWERPATWYPPEFHQPRLHPLVVAIGQGLGSVLALAVCCSSGKSIER